MAYKSIMTVVSGGDVAGSALPGAVAVAQAQDAHLEVLCMGVDVSAPGYYYAGANALIEQQAIERAREEAAATEKAVQAELSRSDIRWSSVTGVAQVGTVAHLVGYYARFTDLVVLPKPYGEGRQAADEAVLEAALFNGNVPVLVLPRQTDSAAFDTVVIGWNESAEAMNAVRAGLPFIVAARRTDIVVVDPPRHAVDRSDPGGRLGQMLSRHGARPEVSVVAATVPRMADVLSRHCNDRDADLLIMGAYGHSRFREALLGGATRDMLESADLPVLMHH